MSEVFDLNNLIVLAALAGAVFTDLKSKRVDNRFVLGVLAVGVVAQLALHGVSGLLNMGASIMTAFAFGLPLYLLKVFGGGDFKLMIAISSLIDWKATIIVYLISFVWGAVLGLFRVILAGGLKSVFHNMLGLALKNKPQQSQLHVMPFTVAIFFAFLSHLTFKQLGWEIL